MSLYGSCNWFLQKRDENDNNVGWLLWAWHDVAGCETFPNGCLGKLALSGNWYDVKNVTSFGNIILNDSNGLKAKAQTCSIFN